jgi:hypothetical protein
MSAASYTILWIPQPICFVRTVPLYVQARIVTNDVCNANVIGQGRVSPSEGEGEGRKAVKMPSHPSLPDASCILPTGVLY